MSALTAALTALLLAACGGGGGGSGSGSSGSGSSGSSSVAACEASLPQTGQTASNQMQVVVDGGPCALVTPSGGGTATAQQVGFFNAAYTTVTLCVPATSSCQTIDHVLVDTGSSGLRIMASVLKAGLLSTSTGLPAVTVGNAPLIECTQFASGYSWGSVRAADIKIAGESTTTLAPAGVSVQVIGDSETIPIPTDCSGNYTSSSGTPAANDTVTSFGANGILGVGLYVQDCGGGCNAAGNTIYYTCPAGTCGPSIGVTTQQVSNPVSFFGTDNQGVILALANLPVIGGVQTYGAQTLQGTLTFGLNTVPPGTGTTPVAGANFLTAQTVYGADQSNSFVGCITSINGSAVAASDPINAQANSSLIDSGSNAVFLPIPSGNGTGNTLPTDSTGSWYTPSSPVTIGTVIAGAGSTCASANSPVSYVVQNATNLFALNDQLDNAFLGLAGPNALPGQANTSGIDFGLPFFYNRSIAVAIEAVPSSTNTTGYAPNVLYVPQGGTTAYQGPFWAF